MLLGVIFKLGNRCNPGRVLPAPYASGGTGLRGMVWTGEMIGCLVRACKLLGKSAVRAEYAEPGVVGELALSGVFGLKVDPDCIVGVTGPSVLEVCRSVREHLGRQPI